MSAYPRWKYHATEPARIVADEEAEAALEGAWFDSPADVPAAGAEPAKHVEPVVAPKRKPGRPAKG